MELLIVVLVVLLYLNASAMYYAALSDMVSKHQLFAQTLLVFLIPFLGAILVLYLSISHIDNTSLKSSEDKPKIRLLSYVFFTFLITKNSTDGFSNDSSTNDFGGSDGGGD
jgi:choline-glycine betaine transporter